MAHQNVLDIIEELEAMEWDDQIDILFQHMNKILEHEASNEMPPQEVDDELLEEEDEEESSKIVETTLTCKVQAGKRKRDDDPDPSSRGFRLLPIPLACLTYLRIG